MRSMLLVLFAVVITPVAVADNWPQWRGPNASGVAAEGKYPVDFSSDENIAWKTELPGAGSSSPVVWGDAIFVTSIIDGQDGLSRFDFDGKEVWQKKLGPGMEGKHRNGSGSNPSPATDGKRVVTYFKSGRVACHDFDGNELWQVNLQEKYGENTLWWDLGTSPVLVGGKVIIAVMQSGDSYLVALNVDNGEEVWKQKRQYVRPEESDHAYTTPQIAKVDGRDVIITWGADHLTGHDAATGKLLWEHGPFNPQEEANWRVIASHAMGVDGVAVVPYGRGKFLAAMQLDDDDAAAAPGLLWEQQGEVGPDVPTPIIAEGKLYILTDTGKLVCRDLRTGDEIWTGALPKDKDKYYASPVLADGKLYCTREDGMMFVAEVIEGFELLTEDGNDMGERIIATPAPVRDSLIIRGEKHLFRVGG